MSWRITAAWLAIKEGVKTFGRFTERFATKGVRQWRWWRGERPPLDEEVGPGHSYIWQIPWLYTAAAKWHDTEGYIALINRDITVQEWNDYFFELAKQDIADEPKWFRRQFLKAFFPSMKRIVNSYTLKRYGTFGYIERDFTDTGPTIH